jgi:hypothetical protein
MKKILLFLVLVTASVGKLKSQNALASVPLNHSTVLSVNVTYSFATSSSTAVSSSQIPTIPQATVALKPDASAARIYFKILDNESKSVLYQVDYLTSSSAVYNDEGKKLFENNNGNFFISSGAIMALEPYIYQVQTATSQGDLSEIYSAVR